MGSRGRHKLQLGSPVLVYFSSSIHDLWCRPNHGLLFPVPAVSKMLLRLRLSWAAQQEDDAQTWASHCTVTTMWRTASCSNRKRMRDWSTSVHLWRNCVKCRWGFGERLQDVLFNDAVNAYVYMVSVRDKLMKEYGALEEGLWQQNTDVREENPIPVPSCPQITHRLVWKRTWSPRWETVGHVTAN